MRRILSIIVTALACVCSSVPAAADVSPQLREQVLQQAQSLALGSSALLDELRSTGFLADPKTEQIVLRAAPAHALAWAALQAERAHAGAAVELLQSVAQGVAANHADAIRYEPTLRQHFSQFSTAAPVPTPHIRKFDFDRKVGSSSDVANRLPPAAQQLLEPISKYAGVHPGGMHGMMVDVLGLHPTVAMDIERSSDNAARALVASIERAPIPPTQEQHMRDVVAALLLHGGDAIRHEDAVRRFGKDKVTPNALNTLVTAREAPRDAVAVTAAHDHDAILALATSMVNNLRNRPDSLTKQDGNNGGGGGGGPSVDFSKQRTPSFETTSRQLHSEGFKPMRSMPRFTTMRSMGGGRGGGGVVMGSPVASSIAGRPVGLSFRLIAGASLVIPVVAMSDGRVLFAPPVRPDIFLAACRIGFGDSSRKIGPLPATGAEGTVLISLLERSEQPLELAEFLVHPAISDLSLGRDLIVTDGANFLFSDALDRRLGVSDSPKSSSTARVLTLSQWRSAVKNGEFGHWYRYVERPILITAVGDVVEVKAQSNESSDVLFEFVRPADSVSQKRPLPERAVIIQGAPEALAEFGALNDFLRTAAITRWAASSGARWIGGGPKVALLGDVRTVIFGEDLKPLFDTRGAVDLELQELHRLLDVAITEVPQANRKDAQRLGNALISTKKPQLLYMEMRSRGYSALVAGAVVKHAIDHQIAGKSNPAVFVLLDILSKAMPSDDYSKLRVAFNKCNGERECPANMLLEGALEAYEPWTLDIMAALSSK
jgi:hypothetical protein